MLATSVTAVIDFLRQHAPFDQMAPAHLEFLAKRFRVVFYARGEVILSPKDGASETFYTIKQGCIRGETEDSAEDESAWELLSGECFPIGALLSRRPVRMTYRAAEDTFCYELDRADFEKLIGQSPVFHDFCTRRMANLLDKALKGIAARSATRMSESALNTPIQRLIQRRPVSCLPDEPVRKVLEIMHNEHIGSMVVTNADKHPLGIFTLHDVLSRVALPAVDLDSPIEQVMSAAQPGLPPDTLAYEAALTMTRNGIGHICVIDDRQRLIGVLSERDLFSLQRVGLVNLSRSINAAEDIDTLAHLAHDIHRLVEQMIAQGASVEQLTQIITELNDAITQRIITLILAQADSQPPPFTWLSFGSEGRFEQTLKTDQDNGILFQVPAGETADKLREQLLPFAKQVNDALAQCGFPLCPGNIMASNPECCLSVEEWQQRFAHWIDHGSPQHLLKAAIYFDFRPLHGDTQAADTLRGWLTQQVAQNSRFRRQMAENAMQFRPPLGLFRDFRLSSGGAHPHTLDIKLSGITPFVDAARIIAFAGGVTETNTVKRLTGAAAGGQLRREDVAAWVEAYQFIQLLRMRHHCHLAETGEELDNRIDPDQLNELDRRILKEAFRQARKLQSKIALDYQL